MADDKGTIIEAAAAEADRTAPPPGVTDLMPRGAAQVGGRKATPVNAAALRFLQSISRALGEDIDDNDCLLFSLYCRTLGASRDGRAALWRRGRDPLALWGDYQDWAFETSADEAEAMLRDHMPEWNEVADAQKIVDGGGQDAERDGGPEGNAATGSQS